jgi:hypothetical protein
VLVRFVNCASLTSFSITLRTCLCSSEAEEALTVAELSQQTAAQRYVHHVSLDQFGVWYVTGRRFSTLLVKRIQCKITDHRSGAILLSLAFSHRNNDLAPNKFTSTPWM